MSSKPSSSRATESKPEVAAHSCSDEQDGKDDGKDVAPKDIAAGNVEPQKKKRKPRGPAIPRDFEEVNRWSLDDYGEEEIHKFIMAYLDDLEEQGGGFEGLLQHADRNDRFGGWTLRRRWPTNNGYTMNTIVNCPFFKQTDCPCQVKIIYGTSMITLLSTNIHTPDDHSEEKNRLKFLTPKAKKLIKTAVKIAPHQTATDLLRNVQGSPTNQQ